MRVAVVDIGTNSTRLLVVDVEDGHIVRECARESRVTRLGEGVDASGILLPDAMDRVFAVLDDYRAQIDELGAAAATAVLTSAVREARNGADFHAAVRARYDLDAHVIEGAEEAQLTFLGATSERPDTGGRLVVFDIGGGSTEIVVGRGRDVSFFVSMQAGVVRQSERHIDSDPPTPDELQGLREEVAEMIAECVPADVRAGVTAGVAVAGTATTSAAIDQALEVYDSSRVHGYTLRRTTLERLLEQMAALPDAERKEIPGLHPDRSPVIVAGLAMLLECALAFDLREIEVSEHDILRGAAITTARSRSRDRSL
jgi:exopolyphosphatase / guanosine-5'-triphosphate,3'-diphosphate pyrophosphatase